MAEGEQEEDYNERPEEVTTFLPEYLDDPPAHARIQAAHHQQKRRSSVQTEADIHQLHLPTQNPILNQLLYFLRLHSVVINVNQISSGRPIHCGISNAQKLIGTGHLLAPTPRHLAELTEPSSKLCIQTSRRLVYNDEEASATTVTVWDHHGNQHHFRASSVNHRGFYGDDVVYLLCENVDRTCVEQVGRYRGEFYALFDALPGDVKKIFSKYIWTVYYSHEGGMTLSYSKFAIVKYSYNRDEESDVLKYRRLKTYREIVECRDVMEGLLHTADTCLGSLGAPIIICVKLDPPDASGQRYKLDIWMHNGLDTKEGLKVSVLRVPTYHHTDAARFRRALENAAVSRQPTRFDIAQDDNVVSRQPARFDIAQDNTAASRQPARSDISTASRSNIAQDNAAAGEELITKKSDPLDWMHVAYFLEKTRQESFIRLLDGESVIENLEDRNKLAEAGFFYAGVDKNVTCCRCGFNARYGDNVQSVIAQHQRAKPSCMYVWRT